MRELGIEKIKTERPKPVEWGKVEGLSKEELKILGGIGKVYDEKIAEQLKGNLKTKEGLDKILALMKKEILPEIPPESLEKVIIGFLKGLKGERYNPNAGIFISHLLNETNKRRIRKELEKGKTPEEIKNLRVHLDLSGKEKPLNFIGFENRAKFDLFVEGLVGDYTGKRMRGGNLFLFGKEKEQKTAGYNTAEDMSGGLLTIFGKVGGFHTSAFSKENNNGEIWQVKERAERLERVWPKEKKENKEK